jgi:hypothetical protein
MNSPVFHRESQDIPQVVSPPNQITAAGKRREKSQ